MNALRRGPLRGLLITAALALGCSKTDAPSPSEGAGGQAAAGAGGSGALSGSGGLGAGGSAGGSGGTGASSGGLAGGGAAGASNTGGTGGTGIAGSSGSGGAPPTSDTFYVSGRDLYDRCGEKVILRGVNEMIVWSDGKDGSPEFAEIAKTGANAVRIVWNEEGSAAELDTAIQNAVAQKLIPMVEHHGATGDLTKVPAVVDYWTQTDVVAVLEKHSPYLLLNIANEAGESGTQPQAFASTYQTAITRIRETGVTVPLVIDAPGWGQDIDVLQAAGPGLIEHDPEKNLLFSVHMWWNDAAGTRVTSELNESVQMGLPLIVGEFAQHAVSGCNQNPFAYGVLLTEAQKHGVGWLAWSWGSVANSDCASQGSFDMTVGGVFGDWEEDWGEEVALTHAASIQKTSVRPQSMVTGSCQ